MPRPAPEIYAGYPQRAVYQRRGGRIHWNLVTALGESLARGDAKTRTAATHEATERRKELIAELHRAHPARRPVPRSEIKPTCCRERRSLDLLR